MNPARRRANVGGHIFQKSDDVVVRPLFNFGNLVDLELPFLANGRGVFFRNQTQPSHRFAGDSFNFQPDLEFARLRPDRAHLRPGITVNHPGNIKALAKAGKVYYKKKTLRTAEPPERFEIYFAELSRPWRAKIGRDLQLALCRCRVNRRRWPRFRGCSWRRN